VNVRRLAPLILVAVLAACGGSPAATSGGAPGQDGPAASEEGPAASVDGGGAPGEPAASADAGQDSDFCALLTEEDIESATGYPVLSTEPSDIGCVWTLDPGNGLPGLEHVSVLVHEPGGQERFAFLETGGHETVPGIGDGALRQNSNNGGTIWALSCDRMLTWTFLFGIATEDPIPLVLPLVEQAVAVE
jgi:hypothetical protein